MIPETHYARSGEVNIAYQVVGSGPVDLIMVPGWMSNIEILWDEPAVARFLRRLASFSRLILFDKRGTGLSDRISDVPDLETRMDDVRAVMDAVGSERATLCGYSEGGVMCLLFAATYPARTAALITIGSYARQRPAPDYPWGRTQEQQERFLDSIRNEWGGPVGLDLRARVAALARPGEVLVSHTVKDLVAGSRIRFETRGTHKLKGVPGEWPLFAAVSEAG